LAKRARYGKREKGIFVRARLVAAVLFVLFVLAGAGPAAAAVPHTVGAGETLWSIAAANNFTTSSLAAYNGLSPDAQVVLGSTIMIPAAGQAGPGAVAVAAPVAAPQPTAQSASSSQVGSAAAQHSTSPSVATGVAYQESGFNNSVVSSAGARGVMQIMPGTWDFIQSNLASYQLNPYSTQDNVNAGVMYLHYLERTMGSEDAAIGAYYQGPNSVRARGLLPETQHYVANVRANANRFGSP
jgi:soluble lytic murein transglycosylase-like protein